MVNFKGLSVQTLMGAAVKLITLDATSRLFLTMGENLPADTDPETRETMTIIGDVAGIGISFGRLAILRNITKKLPMGIGSIATGLTAISAAQIAITEIPNLLASFLAKK